MKKVILRSLSLATVVVGLASLSARAADDLSSLSRAEDLESGKFTPTMEVSARYVLSDSTRATSLDFLSQRFRLGGGYKQGNFVAVGEAEFEGNKYGEYANQTEQNSDGGQSVGIVKAYLGYDFYKEDGNTVGLRLGRFVPEGANQYGDDAMVNWFGVSHFFPADGVMLSYSGKPAGIDLDAQLSIVNNMSLAYYADANLKSSGGGTLEGSKVWGFSMSGASVDFTGGNTYNGNGGGQFSGTSNYSNTSDKAYVANVSASIPSGEGAVEVDVSYMMKNNAIGNTVTDAYTNDVVTTSVVARDVQYTEDSVGYNYKDKLSAGIWGSMLIADTPSTLNSDYNGGASQFTSEAHGIKDTYYVFGLGVQGDSSLFGMSDVGGKGGVLTYAGGAEMFQHRQSGGNGAASGVSGAALSDSDAANNDVTMLSLGGGYKKGNFKSELNYAYFTASNSVFLNAGNNHLTDSAQLLYLMASFAL